ncbi:MAG: hypothetical protein WC979_04330 [Candidatus Pacearchaeota archaeon]|jgi:hypothetical protein
MSRNPFSRKSILEGLGALVVGTSLVCNGLPAIAQDVPLNQGVYSEGFNQPSEPARKPSSNYTLDDFRLVYGANNWNALPSENKERLKQKWSTMNLTQKKSTVELYQSPADFENSNLTKSQRKAIQKADRAAYLIQGAEIKQRISGKSESEGEVIVPIFRKGVDMNKIRAEYLENYPEINPDCLLDFYKDQLTSTRLILMHEIRNYGGKRINPDFLKVYTKTTRN